MKRLSAGEVISSVVFGGAGVFFLLAATDPGRGMAVRAMLALCGSGTGIAAFRFQIAALVLRRREGRVRAGHGTELATDTGTDRRAP